MSDSRDAVWNSMLDVDMNQRYYGHLCRRYSNWDTTLKIIVAVSSSASIASWKIWSNSKGWCDWSAIWQILTAVSAAVAVAMPILNLAKTSQRAADFRGKYAAILVDYEDLWLQVDGLSEDALRKKYVVIRQKETHMSASESDMTHDRNLVLRCQNEVEKGRRSK